MILIDSKPMMPFSILFRNLVENAVFLWFERTVQCFFEQRCKYSRIFSFSKKTQNFSPFRPFIF